MTDQSDYIHWFRSAAAYINAHRGATFVVYLDGELLNGPSLANLVYDLNLMHSLGIELVLVPGTRPQIDAALQEAGVETAFKGQRRVTSAEAMEVVVATVSAIASRIEALFTMGLSGSPMHLANLQLVRGNYLIARPHGVHDGTDFHYTGSIRRLRVDGIRQQLAQGNMVLLPNLGYSLTGEMFNLSALEIATETAVALGADKLLLLSGTGQLTDGEGKLVTSLTIDQAEQRIKDAALGGDHSAQHLQAAAEAYRGGVHRSHLINYENNSALLQELFTRDGSGTLLSRDSLDALRPATIDDVAGILSLIQPMEQAGILVPRSRELLELEIANFHVVELEQSLIACAALYPIDESSAELACIAIDADYQNRGLGDRLLESLETKARDAGLQTLYALTTAASHWFIERGFTEVGSDGLPDARRQLYNYQRNSKVLSKPITD